MIRLLLDPRSALDDVAPELPERVPVQPGDIVIERDGAAYQLYRHDPGAEETGVLVFSSLDAALALAREVEGLPARPRRSTADVVDLARYRARRDRRGLR